MKKISFVILCAVATLVFASCKTGDNKDANGDTPSSVVEKMHKAIKANNFDEAVSYSKIPDTLKIKIVEKNIYEQFKDNPTDKDGKVIVTSDEWKAFLISKMEAESKGSTLDSWEIVDEEISNTDPNSAKVKVKIKRTTEKGQQEAEKTFPLKREDNVWKIIG